MSLKHDSQNDPKQMIRCQGYKTSSWLILNVYETYNADLSMNNVITSVPGMRGSRKFCQRGPNSVKVFF